MEIIESFFAVICSIVVDVLYEKTITNNLFSFDTKKKLIFIKSGKNHKINEEKIEEEPKIYSPKIVTFAQNKNIDEEKISTTKPKKKKTKNKNNGKLTKIKITSELNAFKKDVKAENFIFQTNKDNYDDINKQSIETFKIELKKHNTGMDNDKINIINKIALKDQISSIFYCCSKNKGKTYNIVLKESMKIINEKLDIFNIFRNLFLIEYSKNDINKNLEIMKMSDECSRELSILNNNKTK